jgi:DNA mismatch repair protein MutS
MSDDSTPMMIQYRRLRAELPPDTLLFFRLGDFYEMFFDDARDAAPILDITLTRRQQMPMCGIPYSTAETYIAKLIAAGRKVAICEQMEEPSAARGLVRREITRVITPGTVVEDPMLPARLNTYLASLWTHADRFGLALLDLSVGSFWIEESGDPGALRDLFATHHPAECIVPESQRDLPVLRDILARSPGTVLSFAEDWTFQPDTAREGLIRHFQVLSLDGFGCSGLPAATGAAGAALYYVTNRLRRSAAQLRRLSVRDASDYLVLDDATVRNLELVSGRSGERAALTGSLLHVLDSTRTPMGGRMLRNWLLRPARRLPVILRRQEVVAEWIADRPRLTRLREKLSGIRDLERLITRLGSGGGSARDVRALGASLAALPALREEVAPSKTEELVEHTAALEPFPELVERIDRALVEEPPLTLKEGGVIRTGYHEELDALREAAGQGRKWLLDYQASEQQRTGIRTLKVRHNRVFGYYLEVTKSQLAAVPETYIRKQTLVNAERFITPELKEYENRIFGAQERALQLEAELFQEVREAAVRETERIQLAALSIAGLDALASFAERAIALNYVRPRLTESDRLWIRGGRHPVVEQLPEAERFVPNDTLLDQGKNQIVVLTGPNMAGKSTYIRQVALIALIAHTGSFVPADEAEVPLMDRIFTRVGASDDLARGRSTFMVEMQETANILHNATPRSLIILDEIGRGTSTFDGISIAWAVAEFLHNEPRVKAKTLFATHYHELTDLALTLEGVSNANVLVKESGNRIVFLRRIVPGGADKSYGIHVAQLAGLPAPVLDRAREILGNLEEGEFESAGRPKIARRRPRKDRPGDPSQLALF